MTDHSDKQLELEGALIRRVLECRPEDVLCQDAEPSEVEVATLERLYTEVLGLLPTSLEPQQAPPSVKAALLRRLATEGSAGMAAENAGTQGDSAAKSPALGDGGPVLPKRPSSGEILRFDDVGGLEPQRVPVADVIEPESLEPVGDESEQPSHAAELESRSYFVSDVEVPVVVPIEVSGSAPNLFPDALDATDEPQSAESGDFLSEVETPTAETTGERVLRFDDLEPRAESPRSGVRTAVNGSMVAAGAGGGWKAWALPLAAGVAFLMTAISVKLFVEMREQRQTVAALSADSTGFPQEAGVELRTNLELVTAPGVEICALEPVGRTVASDVRGRLYVAADHQHWYLTIHGLEPSPRDSSYHLWFQVGDQKVSGGTFEVRNSGRVEMSSPTMPEGTSAVSVTLERADEIVTPEGEVLLFGDEMIRLL